MRSKGKLSLRRNIRSIDLILGVTTLLSTYYYISEKTYNILRLQVPASEYSLWHDIFAYMNDGFISPFQYFIVLLLLFQQYAVRYMNCSVMIRCTNKITWYQLFLSKLFRIGSAYVLVNYSIVLILGAVRFGIPDSFSWGNFPLSKQPVQIILITSFLARLNITLYAAVVFSAIVVVKANYIKSYFICSIYFLISDLILLVTPPYMSFKGIAFPSAISYQFFSDGYFINNLISAFILPILFEVFILNYTKRFLKKSFEIGLSL